METGTTHIRRVPVKDPHRMILDALEAAKELGVIPAGCTGSFTIHLNQGGLVGTSLVIKNLL